MAEEPYRPTINGIQLGIRQRCGSRSRRGSIFGPPNLLLGRVRFCWSDDSILAGTTANSAVWRTSIHAVCALSPSPARLNPASSACALVASGQR